MKTWQEFYGPNLGYVLELYERYQQNPDSVDAATKAYFEQHPFLGDLNEANGDVSRPSVAMSIPETTNVNQAAGARNLAEGIRRYGHLAAQLDPLGIAEPPGDPDLLLETYDLTEADLESLPASVVGSPVVQCTQNAAEAIAALRQVYSSTIGYDCAHIRIPEQRNWLRQMAESYCFSPQNRPLKPDVLLTQLTRIEAFEQFCHRTFPGKTRFSIEGLDMMVPILTHIVGWSASEGFRTVALGMAHRGRLNVLAHLLHKDYAHILTEFKDPLMQEMNAAGWNGDVKYHAGENLIVRRIDSEFWDKGDEQINLHISIAPNPSHLEHVNPVAMGRARAAGSNLEQPGIPSFDPKVSLPILIHGDASFSGQGIVAETLNMHRLKGYTTGGTIHIIANNQVGFTTDPHDSRSTLYASDIAKGFRIPVVHVNADDPEACIEVARLASAYLAKFGQDFVIDLIGYRRWGHNEGDEPRFTQPMMYKRMADHPTVREIWAKTLAERNIITLEEAEARKRRHLDKLQFIYDGHELEADNFEPSLDIPPEGAAKNVKTQVDMAHLQALNDGLLQLPPDFTVFSGLKRVFNRQRKAFNEPQSHLIEWGMAENLAFASILAAGTPIRLTGEDVGRGTFGHRQATIHDIETGTRHVPLQHLPQAQAAFEIHNSPLTENAAIGFEYGFSIQRPDCMVIWEAQYGDFVNGAQAIIDEFVVSGWAKWNEHSSLVLLLPHGYEGKGPDHSSARLERFLQLAAETNIRVVNCTTPAQYFHLLRRQAILLKEDALPLIVMTPKSLLRERSLFSTVTELAEGHWYPILDDDVAQTHPAAVQRLILCSGKIFVDLTKHKIRQNTPSVAIARLEQLYTFPTDDVRQVLQGYPNLEAVIWMQEEPKNMGAWRYVEPYLQDIVADRWTLNYLGRPPMASPAEGSSTLHEVNQAVLISRAFTDNH